MKALFVAAVYAACLIPSAVIADATDPKGTLCFRPAGGEINFGGQYGNRPFFTHHRVFGVGALANRRMKELAEDSIPHFELGDLLSNRLHGPRGVLS